MQNFACNICIQVSTKEIIYQVILLLENERTFMAAPEHVFAEKAGVENLGEPFIPLIVKNVSIFDSGIIYYGAHRKMQTGDADEMK